ncbi:MFS transporter [Actinomadura barringtoniae]|uniref:MFS transporter n=1 Tax=Actinomadura barringtoniae TaxID=1427535 RepID=A0A939T301_9ACTN|nr:MFS transporter [Actinomadura barringtoniae]MBO2450411.1 MFS transporter [Actinomadura barringtoniae]
MTATLEAQVTTPVSAAAPARGRWLGLFAILTAMLMNLLDSSIVNVALPVIQKDIGGSYASLQWIVASYTLVMAAGLLIGGRLGDMFGRRRMLLVGAAGFVLASVACAMAFSPETMIAARVAQGVFAAVMIPQGFGLIRDLFPGPDQAKAWGVVGPVIGLASILGPIVAGLFIKADLFGTGWRMVFLINLPLGLVTVLGGLKALPNGKGDRTGGLDVVGGILAAAGMALLVYPLVQGREQGWPAWIFALLGASVVVLGVFVIQQLRRAGQGKTPLVRLSVFARRSYTSGVVFVVAFFIAIIGFTLALGFMLQLGLGYSPIGASVAMSSLAIGAFLGSAGGAMAPGLGRKILHLGLTIMIAGMAGVYLVFRSVGVDLGGWHLAAPLLVFGIGMGMIFVPLFGIIMGEVADDEVGSASASLESIQQLAAALGVAVLGTVFFDHFTAAGGDAPHNALGGAEQVTLIAAGLAVAAVAIGFFLPKKAREMH